VGEKYTRDQLQQMARTVLAARDAGDGRFIRLVITLALQFECHPQQVVQHIEALAA